MIYMNRTIIRTIENVLKGFSDIQLDIGDSCDALAILADDMIAIAEDLKKDVEVLRGRLSACKKALCYQEFQHSPEKNEEESLFVSVNR